MGRYLIPGHEYVDGQTISGPSMTEHVSEAVLKATAISEQVLKDPAALTDELLINDGGTFKKVTIQQIKALILSGSGITPVGGIMDYAGAEAPNGWLLCDGSEVSRETYSVLFEVIGITWGAGNSVSSFNLPDLRGFVTAGKEDMGGSTAGRLPASLITGGGGPTTMGGYGGEHSHTLVEGELAYHQHTVPDHAHTINMYPTASEGGGAYGCGTNAFQGRVFITAASASTATNGSGHFGTTFKGSNAAHNNIQPTRIVNKIIRYL